MTRDEPLSAIGSIKAKLGLLVGVTVVVAALFATIGDRAGVPLWVTLPVTVAAALVVTQWLAHGMTAPLRAMTGATRAMAAGDYDQRIETSSTDEVGQLARSFNAMATDLADVDRQRRQLIATVSHELRTPLAAQRALLENLVDGVVQPDDAALRAALAQSERLSSLVADLLDLSRIEAGAAPLRLAPVRVADLLDRALAEAALDGRPVRRRREVVPPDLTVEADPDRLSQVVANLLDNAARHSPSGGEVRVRATAVDPATWSLTVTDQGPGIPASQADSVFRRFGTGDDAGGGTGLGLSIAAWVCELHGGSIRVDPTPATERGARLQVTLPRRPERHRPETTPNASTRPTEAPMSTPDLPLGAPRPAPAAPPLTLGQAPGRPLVDVLFGRLWPERTTKPVPGLLVAALVVGLVGAVTLPQGRIGLAATVVVLLAAAVMVRAGRLTRTPWTIACLTVGVGLALLTVLRASEWIMVLGVMIAGVLLAATVTRARSLISIPLAAAAWVVSGVRGLPLLGRTLTATSRMPLLWPVLRTLAIAAIGLVLFGGLFASADAVFGSWASALVPDLRWDSIVSRVFVFVFVAGVTLAGAYLALNPPRIADLDVPRGAPVRHRWEWLVPLGVVIVLFAGFLVAQATAMWGGHAYLRRTTGLSYADYVHQGFGQLTVATFLTLVVVGLATRKAPQESAGDRSVLRVALGVLCLLTLAVVASALYRMSLYQDAYGYTVLRLFVDGFELWLGLVVLFTLVAVARLRGGWLPRAALLSGAIFFLGFGLIGPDAWVAGQNIDRFHATGKLDTAYLSTLGPDAVPVLIDRLEPRQAACVVGWNMERSQDRHDDVFAWNLGRSRAFAAARGVQLTPDPTFCTAFEQATGR